MNQARDPIDNTAARAARELAALQTQVTAARGELAQLLQDAERAANSLGSSEAGRLLEANEQLVVAALHARSDAETAARALDAVSRSAELDALTELPNRVLLIDRFVRAIAHARRHGTGMALLFLDLDNFKQINDTLGHAVGDAVLRRVASCLIGAVRAEDTVSRHGGDEFLILLSEVSQPADAALVADKVLAALAVPCLVGEHEVHLAASIGISLFPDDGDDADTLIGRADTAMYCAKRERLGRYMFHDGREPGPGHVLQPLSAHALAIAAHEHRYARLLEANEKLVLATFSARELQDAAEHAQRRQTEFMAVVAHELRNPLAPIRAAAALLRRVRSDEPLLPRMQAIIERQVVHLSRLVSDLLDVSRLSTGKLRIERRRLELAGIVEAAVDTCRTAIESNAQHFELQMPADAVEVFADPVRLTQVLGNLLDNASKYTPAGGVVGLSVVVEGDNVVITVFDSGIGITAEALPRVFEPFVQDTHAVGFNGVGLGLGLTVVRELAQAHGGNVVASSEGIGRGSRFVVTLPLAGNVHSL